MNVDVVLHLISMREYERIMKYSLVGLKNKRQRIQSAFEVWPVSGTELKRVVRSRMWFWRVCAWQRKRGVVSASRSSCSALTHVHISYLWLSNKSCMLIRSAGQPQEMSVCVLTNDVSIALSNVIQFFPLSSLDSSVSFLQIATHIFIFT